MTMLARAAGEILVDFELEVDGVAVLEPVEELELELAAVEAAVVAVVEVAAWTGQVEPDPVEVEDRAVDVDDWEAELEDEVEDWAAELEDGDACRKWKLVIAFKDGEDSGMETLTSIWLSVSIAAFVIWPAETLMLIVQWPSSSLESIPGMVFEEEIPIDD
jgi:hypothetical protein